jgi:sulfatase maturation enzyme AslB (radical SAM superfamily)
VIPTLRARATVDGMTAAAGPAAFHLLAKPTGAICNLDCSYCFFLSKELLYSGSRFRMADDVLEAYIRQLLEVHRTPEVTVNWQGGEPTLMGVDFFRRSVELARKHADGRHLSALLVHSRTGAVVNGLLCKAASW